MSDHFLRIIPTDPYLLPALHAHNSAYAILTGAYPQSRVTYRMTQEVEFVDAGQNFESISCPNCLSALSLEWWREEMNLAHKQWFEDLLVQLPCCAKRASLNDLTYSWSQGFSRYDLTIKNPDRDITAKELELVGHALASSVRVIHTHI